jgi:hypothetical protein
VIAIFVGVVVAVPASMSFTTSQAIDQQQLRNTALNVFNAMLQGTGAPSNWGYQFPFDQNSVRTFGLASSSPFSSYILDSNKVQRIDTSIPGSMNYSYVRNLLGLQGYGFQFSLFRPFKVAWDIQWNDQTNHVTLRVNVSRTEDGAPIPNAVVMANIIATTTNPNKKDEPKLSVSQIYHTEFTDLLGQAEIDETLVVDTGYTLEKAIAFMHITVAGMETMVVASRDSAAQDCLKISTYDETLSLTFFEKEYYNTSKIPSGERKIEAIYGYDFESLMLLHQGDQKDVITASQSDSSYSTWSREFPGLNSINPSMLIFVISVPLGQGEGGRQLVVIAGPFSFDASTRIFQFGPETTGNILTTTRRLVIISGMTYVCELLLWKE